MQEIYTAPTAEFVDVESEDVILVSNTDDTFEE